MTIEQLNASTVRANAEIVALRDALDAQAIADRRAEREELAAIRAANAAKIAEASKRLFGGR